MTGATNQVQTQRKTKVGRVVSDKMDKTIVVSVERLARHPLYKRVIRLTTKFKAHDETNTAQIGDTVRIEESRPLSATKRWRLVEVVARAGEHGSPSEIVAEEAETSEAIHAAAHPGRQRAEEEPAEASSSAKASASAEADASSSADASASAEADAAADDAGQTAGPRTPAEGGAA
jgi:small subunit ribosomal protein S17